MAQSKTRKFFCDGGVFGSSRSTIGGVWAWCETDYLMNEYGFFQEQIIRKGSGYFAPSDIGMNTVTAPNAELFGILSMAEAIEDCSDDAPVLILINCDCRLALGWLLDGWDTKTIPGKLDARLLTQCARIRRGTLRAKGILLGGHPTKADLERGIRIATGKPDLPCSQFNVWCDNECKRLKTVHLRNSKKKESAEYGG